MISHIKTFYQMYKKPFLVSLFLSCICYFLLINNQLTNGYDGLWEYSDYTAGYWELSLGRWFWLYIDQLRFGISTEPITSIITLACYNIGLMLIIDLFKVTKKVSYILINGLFITSVAVCSTLSYRYMSPTFGLSFLLNVLAAYLIIKFGHKKINVTLAGVFVCLGMGAYQANIGCFALIVWGYFIYLLLREKFCLKEFITIGINFVLSSVIGAIFYIVGLKLHLTVFHTSLSGYNGANTYSIMNSIKNLFPSIKNTYLIFGNYYFGTEYKHTQFQEYGVFAIVFSVLLILCVVKIVCLLRKKKWISLLVIPFVLSLPIACNIVFLISTNVGLAVQMTVPLAMCIPILLCVVGEIDFSSKHMKIYRCFCMLVIAFVLYGSFYQIQLDQNAMLEGKIATTSLAEQITHTLISQDYVDSEYDYCIIGTPAGNELFSVSSLYNKANYYADFGCWWIDNGNSIKSWRSVFYHLCGIDLNFCSPTRYNEINSMEEVKDMSCYPNTDSIKQIDNTIVIKVSE